MTFEQKLKAAALEAALHPALRHAAKNPARRKRTGNTFSLCWNTPPDFANDKKDAARSAASFLLYIFLQSRLFAPLFNITSVCQLLTVLCKPF